MSRKNYQTKQKSLISGYLKDSGGRHVTIKDIQEYLDSHDSHIGLTTIYRYMDALVNEGVVNKYIIDNNSSACFEYIKHGCQHQHEHFHLKCEVCNKLIHLECHELADIQKHLSQEHSFVLDLHKTVFYGLCDECHTKRT
ncbi:MAG: transcriptional repressor [Erysipelotrichaceae bacterium]|nr:transcriptional repressor [Erysipelotrichaceae bacterium]